MTDWIMDTRDGDDATWQSVNHTRLNSLGLEAKAQCTMHNAQCTISYSYINQEKDLEPGLVSQYALEYLRHKLVAGFQLPLLQLFQVSDSKSQVSDSKHHTSNIKHQTSKLLLGVNLRWQDRVGQYTDFGGTVQDYAPYCLLDARLTWQHPRYKLYIEGNNLTNRHYVDFGHVPHPGIWWTVGGSISIFYL